MPVVDHLQRALFLIVVIKFKCTEFTFQCALDMQVDGTLLLAIITKAAPLGKCLKYEVETCLNMEYG